MSKSIVSYSGIFWYHLTSHRLLFFSFINSFHFFLISLSLLNKSTILYLLTPNSDFRFKPVSIFGTQIILVNFTSFTISSFSIIFHHFIIPHSFEISSSLVLSK